MDEAVVMLLVFCLLILAGLAIMWLGVQSRRQVREMEHREKMAMIERGLVPPPELDPVGFEERMGARVQANASAVRARTTAIIHAESCDISHRLGRMEHRRGSHLHHADRIAHVQS